MKLGLLAIASFLASQAQAEVFGAFRPRAYPLFVRSTYFNTWLVQSPGAFSPNFWPRHLGRASINGFNGLIKVDGELFQWFSATEAGNRTTIRSTDVTATRTIFTIDVGPSVALNVTFLSPVEPTDLVKQSQPFSYVAVDVQSKDGQPHSIQIYADVTMEWLSSNIYNNCTWSTNATDRTIIHSAQLETPFPMQERDERAMDSMLYLATLNGDDITWQSGFDRPRRQATNFMPDGRLQNEANLRYRKINNFFPALAISKNFGRITSSDKPFVFSVGLVRDPVISYATDKGQQNRRSFFWSKYSNINDMILDFLKDFDAALQRAKDLDLKIKAAAESVSPEYAHLVNMATRQTMTMDITTVQKDDGSWETDDVQLFIKDTDTSRRVNAVNLLYASLPAYLYLNPALVAYALEPLLRYQFTNLYARTSAARDLGNAYPDAHVPTVDVSDGVESTATMLVMIWAHAIYSKDEQLIRRYPALLQRWTESLKAVLDSATDRSSQSPNAIILHSLGLHCGAKILAALGIGAGKYSESANAALADLTSHAHSSGHFQSTLDENSPPALIYHLFADRLLGFNYISDKTYDAQAEYYSSLASESRAPFGLPALGGTQAAYAPWTMFAAAASRNSPRRTLIEMIYRRLNNNTRPGAFPSSYDIQTGATPENSTSASPAQGAMFAILALGLKPDSIQDSGTKSRRSPNIGAIIGGVLGGIAFLLLLLAVVVVIRRRAKQRRARALRQDLLLDIPPPTPFIPGKSQNLSPVKSRTGTSSVPVSPVVGTGTGLSSPAHGDANPELLDMVHSLRREMEEIRVSHLPPAYARVNSQGRAEETLDGSR